MRDPDRIEGILERIKKVWEKHPDLRLGQLIVNAFIKFYGPALFHIEDDKLMEILEQFYKEAENAG